MKEKRDRVVAEQITLGVSLAILVTIFGLITYLFVAGGDQPPVIEVTPQIGEVWQHQNAYYLPVAIANRGDRTAEDVQVELSVRSEQGRLETAPLRVQFLAGGETARGVVVFREDPTRGNLAVGVISYRTP